MEKIRTHAPVQVLRGIQSRRVSPRVTSRTVHVGTKTSDRSTETHASFEILGKRYRIHRARHAHNKRPAVRSAVGNDVVTQRLKSIVSHRFFLIRRTPRGGTRIVSTRIPAVENNTGVRHDDRRRGVCRPVRRTASRVRIPPHADRRDATVGTNVVVAVPIGPSNPRERLRGNDDPLRSGDCKNHCHRCYFITPVWTASLNVRFTSAPEGLVVVPQIPVGFRFISFFPSSGPDVNTPDRG